MSWKTIKTEVIEQNEFLRFFVDDFEVDGRHGKYWYHANPYGDEAVSVFVQTTRGTFMMIREYRYLFDRESISMPQGSIVSGETAEHAARREAREEAGYDGGVLIDLGWFASVPAFSKEKARTFLLIHGIDVGQKLDDMEEIEVVEMTADEIDEAIVGGTIWDGQAIAAWYKVRAYLGL